MKKNLTADEVKLVLVDDAPNYINKVFRLEVHCGSRIIRVLLDGIQLGDIVADAKRLGIPVKKLRSDGIVRRTSRDKNV